jgi:hypothetical protein
VRELGYWIICVEDLVARSEGSICSPKGSVLLVNRVSCHDDVDNNLVSSDYLEVNVLSLDLGLEKRREYE